MKHRHGAEQLYKYTGSNVRENNVNRIVEIIYWEVENKPENIITGPL